MFKLILVGHNGNGVTKLRYKSLFSDNSYFIENTDSTQFNWEDDSSSSKIHDIINTIKDEHTGVILFLEANLGHTGGPEITANAINVVNTLVMVAEASVNNVFRVILHTSTKNAAKHAHNYYKSEIVNFPKNIDIATYFIDGAEKELHVIRSSDKITIYKKLIAVNFPNYTLFSTKVRHRNSCDQEQQDAIESYQNFV